MRQEGTAAPVRGSVRAVSGPDVQGHHSLVMVTPPDTFRVPSDPVPFATCMVLPDVQGRAAPGQGDRAGPGVSDFQGVADREVAPGNRHRASDAA